MLPFDAASVVTLAAAAALLGLAARSRFSLHVRILLVVVAAASIRVDPSRQWSLHQWDESFHAVVAKHAVTKPLEPTLYDHPVLEPAAGDWIEARVWLHKPPLATWLMAMSMSCFGVSAFVMRLPSIALATLGVFLTFLIGHRVFGARVGLLAAGFHAVNGLLVGLASGRRVADHVDTLLITCVQLGAYLLVTGDSKQRYWRRALAVGLVTGAGLLAKSVPALLIAVIASVAWLRAHDVQGTLRRQAWLTVGAVLVAGPWFVYTQLVFPVQATAEAWYTVSHMAEAVENQGGSAWVYVRDMPRFFGELVYIPVVWFVARTVRPSASPAELTLFAWMVVPYVVFSAMTTKMPAYVAIAAPALFVVQAAFWCRLRDGAAERSGMRRAFTILLLVLCALLPGRSLLEPTGPFERRDRWPAATAQLMALDRDLGLPDAVIFNMPRAREAMFYSRSTAYTRMPTPTEIDALHRIGRPLVIFVPAWSRVDVPDTWHARLLFEAVSPQRP